MMDTLKTLLDQERARLLVLEREVAARKERISTLEKMFNVGEFDAFLDGKISPQAMPLATGAVASVQTQMPVGESYVKKQRKRGDVKAAILKALSMEPQHIKTISETVKREFDMDLTYDRVRTQLWTFKHDGLVESPRDGYYQIADKGTAFLTGLELG